MRHLIKNKKSLVSFLTVLLTFLFSACFFVGCSSCKKEPYYELTEKDLYCLSHVHTPSLSEEFEDNRLFIQFKENFSGEIGFSYFKNFSQTEIIKIENALNKNIYITKGENSSLKINEECHCLVLTFSTNDKSIVLSSAKQINEYNEVLVTQPMYITYVQHCYTPTDYFYDLQWGLNGTYGINAPSAWDITTGNSTIKIGIFEDGADLSHEELYGKIINVNCYGPSDYKHGTHVAGIIGATLNSFGISGVANVTIYLLNPNLLQDSISYANLNGIDIINASYVNVDYNTQQPAPYNLDVYNILSSYHGLLIYSSGNFGYDVDGSSPNCPVYPASYDLPNIISVGAINENGTKASFSNYGSSSVDLFAPGVSIISTYPTDFCINNQCEGIHYANGYHYMSGTSMAAPFVTGVAALMLSQYPNMNLLHIKEHILDGVQTISGLTNYCVTGGILDAYGALTSHVDGYHDTGNNTYHYGCTICNNGNLDPQAHTFGSICTYFNNSYHNKTCSVCGHQKHFAHSSNGYYQNLGVDIGHSTTCTGCGQTYTCAHVWEWVNSINKYRCRHCPAISKTGQSPYGYDNLDGE